MMPEVIYYLVSFVFHATLLLATLWIMILIQRLNYNFLGLLGTAAAAGALDMIPYAGHPLSVAMLYYGIGKVTGAPRIPDVMFTIVISWALMFTAKMMLFTALIGDLRPMGVDLPVPPAHQPQLSQQATNEDNLPAAHKKAAAKPANSEAATKFLKQLVIKGAMVNGQKSSATVNYKGKNYVIFVGETVSLPTDGKPVRLKLEGVTKQSVTFSVNGEAATCSYK